MPNGIRVVSERVRHAHSVAIGIWVDTGSRAEAECDAGISHFIEHLVFKGTERRSARQIAEEFDAIGGHLDAFTDKECTCFYAKVLPENVNDTLDVLSDMLRNSLVDAEELEREKNVILEEIKQHQDSEEDLVHDLFAGVLWPTHPLGRPVLGRPEVIEGLTRRHVLEQLHRRYQPGRIILSAAGNCEHEDLVEACERLMGDMQGLSDTLEHVPPDPSPGSVTLSRPAEQVHFCLGCRGFGQLEDDRYPLALIDTAMGGGMSSRLFQEVREKRGLCYSIGSYSSAYREGGMFAIYAATSLENLEEVQDLSRRELATVAREGLGGDELQRAKNQIRSGMLLGLDSMSGRMTRLGRNLMYYGRIVPTDEVVSRIENVSVDETQRVASQLFTGERYAEARIGPFNGESMLLDEEDE